MNKVGDAFDCKQDMVWNFNGSSRLRKVKKPLCLLLAIDVLRIAWQQQDTDGIVYWRKEMIGCGTALSLSGTWNVRQLSSQLQNIAEENPDSFNK